MSPPYDFGEGHLVNSPDGTAAKKAWSAGGVLRTPDVSGGGAALPFNDTVALQANFEDAPGTYTVQFAISYPGGVDTSDVFLRTYAVITWSVEGNDVTRQVDVVSGLSVSGLGQGVSIKVYDDSTSTDGGVNPPSVSYAVAILVVKGDRATGPNPPGYQTQEHADYLAAGEYDDIAIPEDIGVNCVMVTCFCNDSQLSSTHGASAVLLDNEVQVVHMTTETAGATVPIFGTLRSYDPRDVQWMSIAPGAKGIRVVNRTNTPANVLWYFVQFGVDG